MRKLLILFILSAFIFNEAKSQEFSGGIKAGMAGTAILAKLGDETNEVGQSFPRFLIGPYARVQIAHFFRFQVEALFAQRGGSFTNLDNKQFDGKTYQISSYTDRLTYFDIPLVFMLHGGLSSFEIGVQPSFLIGQNTQVEGMVIDDASGAEESLEDQFGGDIKNFRKYSSNDFSFLFGVLFDVPGGVNIGLRLLYSLGNIYDIDEASFEEVYPNASEGDLLNRSSYEQFYRFVDARNLQAQITVGYTFGF